MKTLTYYIDTTVTRAFLHFAGDKLENLNQEDLWSISTVLSKAAQLANARSAPAINTIEIIDLDQISLSDVSLRCLLALNGFLMTEINQLMAGIFQASFDAEKERSSL